MDILTINRLAIDTIIGVRPWEREVKQRIYLSIELDTDARLGALNDDINHAIDYSLLARRLTEYAEASRFKLIESLAEALASIILDEFLPARVVIKLSKPGAINHADEVAIRIERRR